MRILPDSERGFALIGAIWLLLLGTALVAILTLRAHAAAMAASQDDAALQRELDLDAAAESVAADLLINGPRSTWWQLPARGSVTLGATTIDVAVTSEDGRIDLNDADPAVIQDALRGLGVDSQVAEAFLTALLARRQQGRLNSSADVDRLTAALTSGAAAGGLCRSDLFTIDSSLTRPDTTRASLSLARALGGQIIAEATQIRSGEALRIQATTSAGGSLIRVQRVGVLGALPVAISRRWIATACLH